MMMKKICTKNKPLILSSLAGLFLLSISLLPACTDQGALQLSPPDPDVLGVDQDYAVICGSEPDAAAGTFVSSVTPTGTTNVVLDENLSYSIIVCWRVGDSDNVQYLDENQNPISQFRTLLRESVGGPDMCPDPTNQIPTCL